MNLPGPEHLIFIPGVLLLGIVISYTLNPLVTWLEAIRIPRVAGTIIVMAGVIGALILGTYSLRGEVQTIIEQLPEAAAKVASGLARMRISQIGNFQKMQNAASEVERQRLRPSLAPLCVSLPPTSSWTRLRSNLATSCGRARWALS